MSNHSNTDAEKASVYSLLQHANKLITTMNDFNISFNLIGQFENCDDWEAELKRETAQWELNQIDVYAVLLYI